MIENKNFIRICKWAEGNFTRYIIEYLIFMLGMTFYYLAIIKQKFYIKWQNLIFVFLTSYWLLKLFFSEKYPILFYVFDTLIALLPPFILYKEKKDFKFCLRVIVGCGLFFGFQVISLITRNIGLKNIDSNLLIDLILSIDYYIMLFLYYLYANRKKEVI